ncbi:MAG TPA: 16S rRNA (cytosine(967)-C(5))-methyltransferase RsmB [Solirubrobacteraceae bacterium]|nr:16S rRNA (cytosine(967)-C(5))-methyltransferase RsmB [Solirubrobacteraceae bacterium]
MSSITEPAVAPARACAYRVLRRVFEDGAYAEKALQAESVSLDARDRALAMRLAYGAIQRAGTADFLIRRLAGRPSSRIDVPLLASLRLGLYELLYLDGSPDYAVVADAVELAKAPGRRGHGLVNAVLRRAAREGREALLGTLGDDTPRRAAVAHSHPEWIARLWWEALGPEQARALMARDNEPAELALRVNTLVAEPGELAGRLGVATRRDPLLPEALVAEGPFDVHGSALWREGAFTAQSRGAMLVGRTLDPQPGHAVLDLCAAPGGKSTHLAALMGGQGSVVAVDASPARARALEQTVRRMHARSIRVEVGDARLPRTGESYDRVLVDPPCSGLGTLQARPDLRWRAGLAAIEQMRADQFRILDCGAQVLRPGGVLVYSTCTISPTENERLIADFLDARPEFQLDDLAAEMPDLTLPQPPAGHPVALPDGGSALMTLPHRDDTAGFFIARIRRR